MPLIEQTKAPDHANTLELRLALVCYGGVSLAIWMHGVTLELQKLVAASERRDAADDPSKNPYEPHETEHAYWEALSRREGKGEDAVRTRVVIDIVAGTSAGGINGIVLAKALAHNLDQSPVTDVWLDEGDLGKLMGPRLARLTPTVPGKGIAWVAGSLFKGFRPPLNGNKLLKLVSQALGTMDTKGSVDGSLTLNPRNPLELHVTLTDFQGYDHTVPADLPSKLTDRRNRHVLSFRYDPDRGLHGFTPDANYRLAFAARATSSFPGAFPPVQLADLGRELKTTDAELTSFVADQWSIYSLSGFEATDGEFVDGGVLDNAPFGLAIGAIRAKPAATEVDRRLVFIQPHPPEAGGRVPAKGLGLAETVWGSIGKLPRHEPMLDDLLALQAFNERAERVADMVKAGSALVPEDDTGPAAAVRGAGFAYASYLELKLYSVVERLANVACRMCKFPPDSGQASFVRSVLLTWARNGGLLGGGPLPPDADEREPRIAFLKAFDLEYGERRLRFVIRRVSEQYDQGPDRRSVNVLKEQLYGLIRELWEAVNALEATPISGDVQRLFAVEAIARAIDADATFAGAVRTFEEAQRPQLDALREDVEAHLGSALSGHSGRVEEALRSGTASWPADARQTVLDADAAFPHWDVLLYPLRQVSETAELDRVEVMRLSPFEVDRLYAPDGSDEIRGPLKLAGVKAAHFGAFFSRDRRENDYLWGRLDAAEWILKLLLDGTAPDDLCADAFGAVLASEQAKLSKIARLRGALADQVAEFRTGSGTPG
jgi:patatin-related protein